MKLLVHPAPKLRAPVGPDTETDCSTRRGARRGDSQVRVFNSTLLPWRQHSRQDYSVIAVQSIFP